MFVTTLVAIYYFFVLFFTVLYYEIFTANAFYKQATLPSLLPRKLSMNGVTAVASFRLFNEYYVLRVFVHKCHIFVLAGADLGF